MTDQDKPQSVISHRQPQADTSFHRKLGAIPNAGKTHFSVWAPTAERVLVDLVNSKETFSLLKQANGYHTVTVENAHAGDLYFFRVDDGPRRPDPASRFQPQGVHGPSEIVDATSFGWTDGSWTCPNREDLIIYELHIGTFTDAGTFSAAVQRLDELIELGVTAIELMPVAASAGKWNWGYDGVAMFAPMEAYGTPDDFRRFVDAAHGKGIAVFLDVVYNHLGPEGNYLHDFGPYLSDRHKTVWGDAPNFDDADHGDSVRQWFIANALYWLDEFHLDGLRVDAIHCMLDDREPHVVVEIGQAVHDRSCSRGRAILIAESNVYDPEMTVPRPEGGIGFDAMWGDDFLHSTFAVLRPGEQLSNRQYESKTDLEQVLRHGYVFEGTIRKDRERKKLDQRVETHGLIYSIQNHDFIGNHPLGDRLHQLTSNEAHRAAAALLILTPAIPMLFQGEEFASPNPFRFFVDFSDPQLREAVVRGRRREYPQHDWGNGILPTDQAAFTSAKIGRKEDGNSETLRWYKDLIAIRKKARSAGLLSDRYLRIEADLGKNLYEMHYEMEGERLTLVVRLDGDEAAPMTYQVDGHVVLNSCEIGGAFRQNDHVRLRASHAIVIKKPALAK